MSARFIAVSQDAKTGPIPASIVERASCWPGCALYENGYYAETGAPAMHWDRVSRGLAGGSWSEFCAKVAALRPGRPWRYAQAGDLPGYGAEIDGALLQQFVAANTGKNVIAFTHKPVLGTHWILSWISGLSGLWGDLDTVIGVAPENTEDQTGFRPASHNGESERCGSLGLGEVVAAVTAIQARSEPTIRATSSMSPQGLRPDGRREPAKANYHLALASRCPHAARLSPPPLRRRPRVDHQHATLVRPDLADRDDRIRHANDHGYP